MKSGVFMESVVSEGVVVAVWEPSVGAGAGAAAGAGAGLVVVPGASLVVETEWSHATNCEAARAVQRTARRNGWNFIRGSITNSGGITTELFPDCKTSSCVQD